MFWTSIRWSISRNILLRESPPVRLESRCYGSWIFMYILLITARRKWRSISSSLTMSIMTSSIASFSVFPRSGFGGPIDLGFPESTDPSPVHIYKDGHQNSKDWDDDHANSYRQDSIVVVVSGIKRYQSTLKQKKKIKDMNIRNPWKLYLLQIRSSHAGVLFRIKHNLNTVVEKPFMIMVIIFFVCSCLLNIFFSVSWWWGRGC